LAVVGPEVKTALSIAKASWSAVAEHSSDTSFARAKVQRSSHTDRSLQSAVASHLLAHSKVWRTRLPSRPSGCAQKIPKLFHILFTARLRLIR
jgi:hypothetical protein